METINQIKGKLLVEGSKFTRDQIRWAFSMVGNLKEPTWKQPISKRVMLTNAEVKMVEASVMFFTGVKPVFRPVIGKPNTFLVEAK